MSEKYVYQIEGEGEDEHGGPQIVHVVASDEVTAAKYVREHLDFVLVGPIVKQCTAWLS